MKILDAYDLSIKINGAEFQAEPSNFSFSIKDSIHSLYPKFILDYNDIGGVWQEYLLNLENMIYDITFGIQNDFLSSKFVVIEDDLMQLTNPQLLAGYNNITGLHEYYDYQEIKGTCYKNTITNIINQLISNYNFKSKNVEVTTCNNYWTQPLMTDAEFMTDILLPNTYNKAIKSPYFLYIDNTNTFNLKSYSTMIKSLPVETYNYNLENIQKPDATTTIIDMKRIKMGSTVHKQFRKRNCLKINQTTGNLIKEDDYIYSYPSEPGKYLPIIKNREIQAGTGYEYLSYEYNVDELGLQEAQLGRQINSTKKALSTEKFLITVIFNPKLVSGKMIEINVPSPEKKTNSEKSITYSGKFLIEECEHVWDSNEKIAVSKLVATKKYIDVNKTNFILIDKLFKSI